MKFSSIAAALSAAIALCAHTASAGVEMLLASVERTETRSVDPVISYPAKLDYWASRAIAMPSVFVNYLTIDVPSPGVYGGVHTIDDSTLSSMDWADFNWLMTNGENNRMRIDFRATGSNTVWVFNEWQSSFFGAGANPPDLEGFILTRVEVELLNLQINPSRSDSRSTFISHTTRYDFYGVIPSPGALSLAALAAIATTRRRRG